MRGEEAGRFHTVAGNGMSIVAAVYLHSAVDTLAELDNDLGTSLLQATRLLKPLFLVHSCLTRQCYRRLHQNVMGLPAPRAPVVATPMRYSYIVPKCFFSEKFCGLVWSAVHTSRELKSLHTRGCGVWNWILAITEHIYCIADT